MAVAQGLPAHPNRKTGRDGPAAPIAIDIVRPVEAICSVCSFGTQGSGTWGPLGAFLAGPQVHMEISRPLRQHSLGTCSSHFGCSGILVRTVAEVLDFGSPWKPKPHGTHVGSVPAYVLREAVCGAAARQAVTESP